MTSWLPSRAKLDIHVHTKTHVYERLVLKQRDASGWRRSMPLAHVFVRMSSLARKTMGIYSFNSLHLN